MYFLSTLLSTLANAAGEAVLAESDSLERAKELLELIKSPTAIATGVLLGFTTSQLNENDKGTVKRPRTWWALTAALLAAFIAGTVVAVMTPLAWRVTVTNAGNGIQTRLLVYGLTYLVAVGTTAYAIFVVHRALRHLGVHVFGSRN